MMLREAVCVMPGFSRVAGGEKGEHRQQTRGGRCVLGGVTQKERDS